MEQDFEAVAGWWNGLSRSDQKTLRLIIDDMEKIPRQRKITFIMMLFNCIVLILLIPDSTTPLWYVGLQIAVVCGLIWVLTIETRMLRLAHNTFGALLYKLNYPLLDTEPSSGGL